MISGHIKGSGQASIPSRLLLVAKALHQTDHSLMGNFIIRNVSCQKNSVRVKAFNGLDQFLLLLPVEVAVQIRQQNEGQRLVYQIRLQVIMPYQQGFIKAHQKKHQQSRQNDG